MSVPTESQIQRAVVQWAHWNTKAHPELGLLHAIPNGGKRSKITAAIMKGEGVLRGFPDLGLPVARHGFHGLYLEAKTPTGKLSPEQKTIHALLEWQNFKVVVFRSVDEGIAILTNWVS